MIKKIQAETGARVQFQQGHDEGPGDKRCYLSGKPMNVDQVCCTCVLIFTASKVLKL